MKYLALQLNTCLKIGEGGNGCVIDCNICNEIHGKTNERIVTKLTSIDEAEEEMEIAIILKKIDPDMNFIIYPLGICPVSDTNRDYGCRLGEYLTHGLVQPYGGTTLSSIKKDLSLVTIIVTTLIKGASILESHGYIHGDIKPDNIVISDNGSVRFIDIGWVRDKNGFYSSIYSFKGYAYYPPEFKEKITDFSKFEWDKIDTWGIAFSMVCYYDKKIKRIDNKIAGLLAGCLNINPAKRFNAKTALEYLENDGDGDYKEFSKLVDYCLTIKNSMVVTGGSQKNSEAILTTI